MVGQKKKKRLMEWNWGGAVGRFKGESGFDLHKAGNAAEHRRSPGPFVYLQTAAPSTPH